ncbi:hypothetical protein AX14_013676 [Amanita brunnescens Koide BX004]|nr:hypothetical protein AX14_013676 [Amanita brunnescens Koide BX004]
MDSNFPVPQPNPNRFHNWIIAVIVAIAIVVLLMFFYVIRRRQAVRNRTYDPTPTRIESGFNRDLVTDAPPAYTPGPPAYPPETHHHYHTDAHHTTHVNVNHHIAPQPSNP